jgi:hypothetical protein
VLAAGGVHLVFAVGVGCHHIDAVADNHTLAGLSVNRHTAHEVFAELSFDGKGIRIGSWAAFGDNIIGA